jgi:hypothetical protein
LTLKTCRQNRYTKSSDIAKRKLAILDYLRGGGSFKRLKKELPEHYVSYDTVMKWRSTDPLFDQVISDLTGGKSKVRQEPIKKRNAITVQHEQTKEQIDKICSALQRGVTLKAACGFAAITQNQLQALMERNKDIYDRVTVALHSFEVLANQKLQSHYDKDWRAIAWHLERRLPHDYGEIKNIRVEHAQEQAEALPQVLSAEEQARLDEINRKIAEIEEGI